MTETNTRPLVGIIMGSQSDWETMQHAATQLADLQGAARETATKLISMSRDFQNDPKFKKLPPHLKSLVMSRMLAIQEINAGENVTAGVAAIARRYNSAHGWGKGTIRNLYYSFIKNQDWQVLLEKEESRP